jgi:hypothetical protein
MVFSVGDALADPLMRAGRVVVFLILGQDGTQVCLVHAMRTRVLTSPAFDGSRVLAAILFEQTMERDVNGIPRRGICRTRRTWCRS